MDGQQSDAMEKSVCTCLPSNRNLGVLLKSNRCLCFIAIVEDDRDTGFRHSSLASLVDQVLEIRGSDGRQVRDPEHEADRVENVGFPRSIEASNRVERWIEATDGSPDFIWGM